MDPNEHPKTVEPGEVVTTPGGEDEDGYPIVSTNVGATAASIAAAPGQNG